MSRIEFYVELVEHFKIKKCEMFTLSWRTNILISARIFAD